MIFLLFFTDFTFLLLLNQLLIRWEWPPDAAKPYSITAAGHNLCNQLFYNSSSLTTSLTSARVTTSAANS